MEEAEAQSILQGLAVAATILAAGVAGFTYLSEGAINWRMVWIIVFVVTLPGLIHIYLEQ